MINEKIRGHAIWDRFCHIHQADCGDRMDTTIADLDYAVHAARCPHNCGDYQAEVIERDGNVIGHHYRCACSGCNIILRTG